MITTTTTATITHTIKEKLAITSAAVALLMVAMKAVMTEKRLTLEATGISNVTHNPGTQHHTKLTSRFKDPSKEMESTYLGSVHQHKQMLKAHARNYLKALKATMKTKFEHPAKRKNAINQILSVNNFRSMLLN